jgi:hypothetical protein
MANEIARRLRKTMTRVLRFWNIDGVLQTIDMTLSGSHPHPAAFGGHPPPSGGG